MSLYWVISISKLCHIKRMYDVWYPGYRRGSSKEIYIESAVVFPCFLVVLQDLLFFLPWMWRAFLLGNSTELSHLFYEDDLVALARSCQLEVVDILINTEMLEAYNILRLGELTYPLPKELLQVYVLDELSSRNPENREG